MADLDAVLRDLADEGAELDALVSALPDLSLATPAPGWTVADQIGHLAWTDEIAALAASDADAFADRLTVAAGSENLATYVDDAAAQWAARPDLVDAWRAGRTTLASALAAVPEGTKLPWFGPPMSATSMATARLMETWAHGQDVVDGAGVHRAPTDRLRQVAHIGVRTRDFAYAVRGERPPGEPFRIELVAPSGEQWAWGPDDAAQHVSGPALDFCLLVTQRRHRDDLALVAEGPDADHWLDIAQSFAGAPGVGRAKGQFA